MKSTMYKEMVLVVYFFRAAKLTEPFFLQEDTVFYVDPIQYLVCGNWLGNGR